MRENLNDRAVLRSPNTLELNRSDLLTPSRSSGAALSEQLGNFVTDRPLTTAAIGAGVVLGGVGIAALCRRVTLAAERAAASEGTALVGVELRAGQGSMKTIDGSPIPDLERPFLKDGTGLQAALVDKSREAYAGDLVRLYALPRELSAEAGENLSAFAGRQLSLRAAVTGEKSSSELISKEAERISRLNGGLAADAELAGARLTVLDREGFVKVAEDLQFKHVPQIGQFLKNTGRIGEAEIDTALAVQKEAAKSGERKLLGEILVEQRLATKADVDLAFANQQELKAALKTVREKFLDTVSF